MLISCVVNRYSMTRCLMILRFRCLFSCLKRECSGIFCMSDVSTIDIIYLMLVCVSVCLCVMDVSLRSSRSSGHLGVQVL